MSKYLFVQLTLVHFKFLFKLINQKETLAIIIVIKMQFTVFCSVTYAKLCYKKDINRSSSVIIGTISKQISAKIRPKITSTVTVLPSLSFYSPWSVPTADSSCGCFFSSRDLCYVIVRVLSLILTLSYSDQYFKSHVVLLIADCISVLSGGL